MTSIKELLDLFDRKGDIAYDGEGISQLVHAWQCGQLAEQAGASPALQLASWLHDIGHLMSGLEGTPTLSGIDDHHESIAAGVLRPIWGDTVAVPVGLHVQAKRFMVSAHPAYLEHLSDDSRRSLALQGGPMSTLECIEFQSNTYALDAQQLRTWDDLGKRANWFAPSRQDALKQLENLMEKVPVQP